MNYQLPEVEYSSGPYVYAYLDPTKPGSYLYPVVEFEHEPFYIGMGTKNRCLFHTEYSFKHPEVKQLKYNKIRKIYNQGSVPIVLKLLEVEDREEAVQFESDLIKMIGRSCDGTGPLANLTEGDTPIDNLTKEQIEKRSRSLSEAMIGNDRWKHRDNSYLRREENIALLLKHACTKGVSRGKGVPKSESHRKNLAASLRGRPYGVGIRECMLCGEEVKFLHGCIMKHFRENHGIEGYEIQKSLLSEDFIRVYKESA